MPDLIEGLKAAIAADSVVSTLILDRIYDEEIQLAQDPNMPQKSVVVARASGPGGPATLQQTVARIQVKSYAETPHLAQSLHDEVSRTLKLLPPGVWATTYITGCILASGDIATRDPAMQWPYVVSSWLVRFSDLTVVS